jgi:SAM-dependent methyltransferase
MERFSDYDPFAWLYATRWGSEYHEQAWHILDKLLFHQLDPGASVLDLCCGDGRFTAVLHARRFRVMGIDGSEEMLAFARERCPAIQFVANDARTFDVDCRFDAVVSTFDSLNHVMSPDELALVCRRVELALKPGGYFAFDINREEAYTELWPQTYAQIEPDVVQVCAGSYRPETRVAMSAITLFRLIDGAWRRSDFMLSQYSHREEDVLNSLFAAGFVEAKAYDAAADLGMYGNIGKGRSYFLARRGI